jgi:hypothetical protein
MDEPYPRDDKRGGAYVSALRQIGLFVEFVLCASTAGARGTLMSHERRPEGCRIVTYQPEE